MNRLRRESELAKIRLSELMETKIVIEKFIQKGEGTFGEVYEDYDFEFEFTRADFEEWA